MALRNILILGDDILRNKEILSQVEILIELK